MAETEELTVSVDASEAEKTLTSLGEALNKLEELITSICTGITNAFGELQKSFKNMASSIGSVTKALNGAAAAFEDFSSKYLNISSIDQWTQDLIDGFDTVMSIIGSMAGVVSVALAAGLSATTAGIAAIVIAAVAAIIAVITTVIKHWDEIVTFFTETIPQLWSQVTTWFTTLLENIKLTFTDTFYNIGVIVSGCWEVIQTVWKPVASWFGTVVIKPIEQLLTALWNQMPANVQNVLENIMTACRNCITWINENIFHKLTSLITEQADSAISIANRIWNGVKNTFSNVAGFFKEKFGEAWTAVMNIFEGKGDVFFNLVDAVLASFKQIVNAIIRGINSVVRVPFNGINSALSSLRSTEVLGMYPFGRLGSIRVPQIPYLAQGAVLPANKPFLAMVGDQRHGTNVEAPLTTIQEAVAVVMDQHIDAMMAGFEAMVSEQRQTRHTIEGIQVGDSVIGQAVDRYRSKMAVVNGGFV